MEVLDEAGIDTSNIARDKEGETALAFVSLASDGNRDFKFYRKNSADLRYSVEDIPADILNDCGMIHFCSVDLVESPMKEAHKKLIDMAIAQNVKVSFDPNLRFSLWDDLDQLKETVNDFLKYADIIKILTKNWNLSQDIQISKMLWTVYLLIVQNTLSTQKELTEQKCIREMEW